MDLNQTFIQQLFPLSSDDGLELDKELRFWVLLSEVDHEK